MKILRPLARLVAFALLLVLCLPVLALVPASLVDQAATGGARRSLFPSALTILDPLTWDCAWNSTVVAALVTTLSLLIGSGLAFVVGPRRFWGRGLLRGLMVVPIATGPFVAALGLKLASVRLDLVGWLNQQTGSRIAWGLSTESWLSWLILVLAYLFSGTLLVLWATEEALARVDPRRLEAGRILGASRRRAWRDLIWPSVRPRLAASAAIVFGWVLFEPGAPLAAGLPRTLSYQAVESLPRGETISRGAVLATIAILLAVLARVILSWWGGPKSDEPPASLPPQRASWIRAMLGLILGGTWSVLGLLPIAGLLLVLRGDGTDDASLTRLLSLIFYDFLDRSVVRMLATSALVGLGVALVCGPVTWLLLASGGLRAARVARLPFRLLELTPSLAVGVGALACVHLIRITLGPAASSWLDPLEMPGILLLLAAAGSMIAIQGRQALLRDARVRPELLEAALAFGASKRRATQLARGPGSGLRSALLVAVVAATSLSPALVLCPTSDVRPIGPSVLDALDNPPKAAALGLLIVFLNLLALPLAQDRTAPPRRWFRRA